MAYSPRFESWLQAGQPSPGLRNGTVIPTLQNCLSPFTLGLEDGQGTRWYFRLGPSASVAFSSWASLTLSIGHRSGPGGRAQVEATDTFCCVLLPGARRDRDRESSRRGSVGGRQRVPAASKCFLGVSHAPTAGVAPSEVLAGSQGPDHLVQKRHQCPSSQGFPGQLEECLGTQG